jgi:hypothetical protein
LGNTPTVFSGAPFCDRITGSNLGAEAGGQHEHGSRSQTDIRRSRGLDQQRWLSAGSTGTIARITVHEVEVRWDSGALKRYRRAQLYNLRHVNIMHAGAECREVAYWFKCAQQ